jgi:site-specific DNA-methyltransferase (adenine-specific)
VFLREAAKRLMVGLKDAIPDEAERREHIFKNMLHGFAITELTALVSRRTLYYSKDAHGDHAIIHFDNPDGNILYDRRDHTWKGKDGSRRCEQCGAPEGIEREGMENHAYRFIHLNEKEKQMKFDVIIGNPPYQLKDGGGAFGIGASSIYHLFIQQAKKMNARYISFIVPSRWLVTGKGMEAFREEMIKDRSLKNIVDFRDASSVFPGVAIGGGICYFLRDSEYEGDCSFTLVESNGSRSTGKRDLREFGDVIIRDAQAAEILRKVMAKKEKTLDTKVSASKPFGMRSNFDKYSNAKVPGTIPLYIRGGKVGWVDESHVTKNKDLVGKYKVLVSKAYAIVDGENAQVINKPLLVKPNSACTESYLIVGSFDTEKEAINMHSYVKTKFFRFMLALRRITQNTSRSMFGFIPDLPVDTDWTDSKLYKKYGLTGEEQAYIEKMIKEMP